MSSLFRKPQDIRLRCTQAQPVVLFRLHVFFLWPHLTDLEGSSVECGGDSPQAQPLSLKCVRSTVLRQVLIDRNGLPFSWHICHRCSYNPTRHGICSACSPCRDISRCDRAAANTCCSLKYCIRYANCSSCAAANSSSRCAQVAVAALSLQSSFASASVGNAGKSCWVLFKICHNALHAAKAYSPDSSDPLYSCWRLLSLAKGWRARILG